jgi:hypothetical protein
MWHIGVFFPLLINFFWSIYRLIQNVNGDTIVAVLVAVALLLMFISARVQILTVQDRVIRLEMRLRLRELLPPDLQPQISKLTVRQLIALRFASDAELAALVREVLGGKYSTAKDIKAQVRDWQPDVQRA